MGISLSQINQEADNKYEPFIVEDIPGGDVTLLSPIRLPKGQRDKLVALTKELGEARSSNDVPGLIRLAESTLLLVSVGDGGKRLTKELDGDLAKIMFVLEQYSEQVGLGEASRSDS